jgi:hypothetical protein
MAEEMKVSPEAAPPEATASTVLAFRNRPPVEHHDMPDGRRVFIHGLSDYEVHQWLADCGKKKEEDGGERIDDPTADAKLLIRAVRDGKGKPLFTDADITRLIELPNFVKAPLIRKAMKVSAIGGAADAEILKNYAATLAAGS